MKISSAFFLSRRPVALAASALIAGLGVTACGGDGGSESLRPAQMAQPALSAQKKSIITVDGRQFKDMNANGKLDPYEDWRLDTDKRVDDLVAKMSLAEKTGMMMIETLNAGCGGALTPTASNFIGIQKMNHFILRSVAKATPDACDGSVTPGRGGYAVTPEQLATFSNAVQALAEATPLGIPAVFKDNARNHFETDPRVGISGGSGAFTEFSKEAGLAAAALGEEFLKSGTTTIGDMAPVRTFTEVMGQEYNAVGLRALYDYMADLATEPRWYRVHETFTEDADLNANIMKTLVLGLQGGPVNPKTAVAMTMKHFPGGGPQEQGLDPHYSFGKNQVYPGGNFAYHLKPFMAAIDAGGKTLPLKAGAKVYAMDMGKADVEKYGYAVTDGNYDATKGQ
ncbi:MAG: xylan 1,4-beta-xylosidase, partial [Polaromonas sp.]|nr:xylan 1,4-beta-xylosidase [Polaromonas sp.]